MSRPPRRTTLAETLTDGVLAAAVTAAAYAAVRYAVPEQTRTGLEGDY